MADRKALGVGVVGVAAVGGLAAWLLLGTTTDVKPVPGPEDYPASERASAPGAPTGATATRTAAATARSAPDGAAASPVEPEAAAQPGQPAQAPFARPMTRSRGTPLESLRQAALHDPRNSQKWANLGKAYEERGDKDLATSAFRRALVNAKNPAERQSIEAQRKGYRMPAGRDPRTVRAMRRSQPIPAKNTPVPTQP